MKINKGIDRMRWILALILLFNINCSKEIVEDTSDMNNISERFDLGNIENVDLYKNIDINCKDGEKSYSLPDYGVYWDCRQGTYVYRGFIGEECRWIPFCIGNSVNLYEDSSCSFPPINSYYPASDVKSKEFQNLIQFGCKVNKPNVYFPIVKIKTIYEYYIKDGFNNCKKIETPFGTAIYILLEEWPEPLKEDQLSWCKE